MLGQEKEAEVAPLSGIWVLTVQDVRQETAWLYMMANTIVESLTRVVGGNRQSIRSQPRRAGFHVYGYYLASDVAQCLRYARGEAEMAEEYVDEVVKNVQFVLAARVAELDVEAARQSLQRPELPSVSFSWEWIEDRPLGMILRAAVARRLLDRDQPVPRPLAEALTGWKRQKIAKYRTADGTSMSSVKTGRGSAFDAGPLRELVLALEERFFDQQDYAPL